MSVRDSRITVSGAVIEDPASGRFAYGTVLPEGGGAAGLSGRLTVTGGAQDSLASAAAAGTLVEVGIGAGHSGEVVVADPGSRLDILSTAPASPGPRLRVGQDGGDGALLVLSGGAVTVTGASPRATVGSGAGSQGLVDLIAGRLELSGAAPVLVLGEDGGSGRMRLLTDGRLTLAASAGPATLEVGARGGSGDLVIGSGLALLHAGRDGIARLALGLDGGTGRIDIAGPPPLDGAGTTGMMLLGGSAGTEVSIGRAGTGTLALDGGFLALMDPAAELELRAALGGPDLGPAAPAGGPALLSLGSVGGTGMLTATGGAAVIGHGHGPAALAIGDGGSGTLALAEASLRLESLADDLSLTLGAAGGSGSLQIGAGAEALLRAAGRIDAALGSGGSATLAIDGGTLALQAGGAVTVQLGGTATVSGGGSLALAGADSALTLAGTLQIGAGSLALDATGAARLDVTAGGRLDLGAGATLRLTGDAAGAGAPAERLAGDGQATLAAGASLSLSGDASFAAGGGLQALGGFLSLSDGARLDAGDEVALGNGARLVLDGATFAAPFLGLDGGALLVGTGTLAADVVLIGAALRPGDTALAQGAPLSGLGTLEVAGSLAQAAGSLVVGFGAGGTDLISVSGRLALVGTDILLDAPAPGAPLPGGALLLARAAGGIALDSLRMPEGMALELRAGNTELWLTPAEPPPSPVTVTGTLRSPQGTPLDGVAITFEPAVEGPAARMLAAATDRPSAVSVAGDFTLALPAGSAGRLGATPTPAEARPDIGTALDMLRMSVGLRPSWGEARAEDYIAADLTGDGRVTGHDALAGLRSAVGLATDHAPRWVFLDAGQEIGPQGRDAVSYASGLWIAPETDAHVELTAILVGHPGAFG
jgi:T5SS/PEP-CTERM-associated repeat protein